jgi:hypothetical protein
VASILVITGTTSAVAGNIIQVTNNDNTTHILSDLIVYDANGNKKTLLKPGDTSDDVSMNRGTSRVFDAGFEVDKYVISESTGGVLAGEAETEVFKVKQLKAKKIGMLLSPNGVPIFASVNYSSADFTFPSEGTIISFSDGASPALPGYFVGTSIDLNAGTVTDPYTGSADLVSTAFSVATIPEPWPGFLFAAGLVAIGAVRAWRVKRRAVLCGRLRTNPGDVRCPSQWKISATLTFCPKKWWINSSSAKGTPA